MNMILWGILAYIAFQLIVGLLVSTRIKSESDYLLGGRRFGRVMLTMTIFATWFGAETCIGASGEVYANGLAGARMDPFGYTLCLFLMGILLAAPLWRKKYTTLADLFKERYSGGVEKLAVVLMVPTSVIWASAQIRAFGSVLSASSDLDINIAITVSAVVVILYTARGGMIADAITDFVQGVVLILGLVLIVGVIGWDYFGGNFPAFDTSRLNLTYAEEDGFLVQMESWSIPIIGSLLSQELISRALAARSPNIARQASLLGAGLYLFVGMMPVLLGLIGPIVVPDLANPEGFLPALAQKYLNPVVYVIFAGALISAILSTVDSCLLAAGALTSHNLIIPMFKDPSEKVKVRISRWSVVVFGLFSYWLAMKAEGIHDLVEEASAFGSTGIFVVVMFGLFTPFGKMWSGYVTLVVGITVYVLGSYFIEVNYPYLLSLGAAIIAYVVTASWEHVRERSELPSLEPRTAEEES